MQLAERGVSAQALAALGRHVHLEGVVTQM
jgi:hypothetical protein